MELMKESDLQAQFNTYPGKLSEPSWVLELRKKALSQLLLLKTPDTSMESWRRISLSNLDTNKYINSFRSNKTISIDNSSAVDLQDLNDRNKDYAVSKFTELLTIYSNNFFALLNLCFFTEAKFITIPDNFTSNKPISIKINHPANIPSSPLLFIRAGKFSKCTIAVNSIIPDSEEINFVNTVCAVEINESAAIKFIDIEDFSNSAFHFKNTISFQKRDSFLNQSYFNYGGYKGKTFIENHLNGENATSKILGAACPAKRELQDVEFSVKHNASRTESDLKFKTVVKDKSHHIFTGNLYIPKTSLHVVSSQVNNNLTLSKSARAESMPKLEVFADDVKCSHGATVGEVSEDQLFFLMSRGLSEEQAIYLIIDGFLQQILDLVEEEEITSEIIKKLTGKLHT